MSALPPPTLLADHHNIEAFTSDEPAYDRWLKTKARHNDNHRAPRTYVFCNGSRVLAYYALASGSVTGHLSAANGSNKKEKAVMPEPVATMVLTRLAVDKAFHGPNLKGFLIRDAIFRVLQVADTAGIKALLAHAISDDEKRFYEDRNFVALPDNPMTLVLPM